MTRGMLLIVATIGLAACGGSDDGPAVPAMMTLTEDGLDGVGAGTPFVADAVRDALPGREVRFGVDLDRPSPEQRAMIAVRMNGEDQAYLYTDEAGETVVEINVVGDRVRGPRGAVVGARYPDVAADDLECRPDGSEEGGLIVCAAPEAPKCEMRFAMDLDDPDATETGDLSTQANATLSRIVWRAPAAERLKPAYECRDAAGPVETAICGSSELAEIDKKLNTLYERVRKTLGEDEKASLRTRQIRWIAGRDDCWRAGAEMRGCIKDVYTKRMRELREIGRKACGRVVYEGREPHRFTDDWWEGCAAAHASE